MKTTSGRPSAVQQSWTSRKNLDHKIVRLEAKTVDMKESTFEGFSAGIGNRDDGDDVIKRGAFTKTIADGLERNRIKLLDHHNRFSTSSLFGTVVAAEERPAPKDLKAQFDGLTHILWSRFQVSRADPAAQVALGKVAEGHLDALSIGYVPIKVSFVADEDSKEDPQFSWLFGRGQREIDELAWWETSLVIWGMNEAAVIVPEAAKALLSFAEAATQANVEVEADDVKAAIAKLRQLIPNGDESVEALGASTIKRLAGKMEGALRVIEKGKVGGSDDPLHALALVYEKVMEEHGARARGKMLTLVGSAMDRAEEGATSKAAIPYASAHASVTAADDDAEWDAAKERKACPADETSLRKMHAWSDPDGDPTSKSTYKFPHAMASDGFKVNKKACEDVIVALNSARAGSIPADDRKSVYNHVKRHLVDDFGVDPDEVPALKASAPEGTEEKEESPLSDAIGALSEVTGVLKAIATRLGVEPKEGAGAEAAQPAAEAPTSPPAPAGGVADAGVAGSAEPGAPATPPAEPAPPAPAGDVADGGAGAGTGEVRADEHSAEKEALATLAALSL